MPAVSQLTVPLMAWVMQRSRSSMTEALVRLREGSSEGTRGTTRARTYKKAGSIDVELKFGNANEAGEAAALGVGSRGLTVALEQQQPPQQLSILKLPLLLPTPIFRLGWSSQRLQATRKSVLRR